MTVATACAPVDYAPLGGDCNDANPSVNPGTADVCNRIDDNCDGTVDEGVLDTFHRDADGDGFGDPTGATIEACAAPSGYVSNYTDCDDTTGRRNPGLTEVCDDMPDNDCTATTFTFDADRDGSDRQSRGGTDCDDTSAAIGPGLPELCDRLDNDCSSGGVLLSEDGDGDGFAPASASCTGGALPRTDCNDSRGDVSPSAAEICNGRDDDCDGLTDENPEAAASCNLTGTTGSCVLGACTIAACTGSYANCDGIVAVSSSCALRTDGSVWCWGSIAGYPSAVPIASLTGIVEIAANDASVCARTSTGTVRCYGADDRGQRGDGPTPHFGGDPATDVLGLIDAVELAAGERHFCARRPIRRRRCSAVSSTLVTASSALTRRTESSDTPVRDATSGGVNPAASRT